MLATARQGRCCGRGSRYLGMLYYSVDVVKSANDIGSVILVYLNTIVILQRLDELGYTSPRT